MVNFLRALHARNAAAFQQQAENYCSLFGGVVESTTRCRFAAPVECRRQICGFVRLDRNGNCKLLKASSLSFEDCPNGQVLHFPDGTRHADDAPARRISIRGQAQASPTPGPARPNSPLDGRNREHRRDQRGGQRQDYRDHRHDAPKMACDPAPRQQGPHASDREDHADGQDSGQGRGEGYQPLHETEAGVEPVRHGERREYRRGGRGDLGKHAGGEVAPSRGLHGHYVIMGRITL